MSARNQKRGKLACPFLAAGGVVADRTPGLHQYHPGAPLKTIGGQWARVEYPLGTALPLLWGRCDVQINHLERFVKVFLAFRVTSFPPLGLFLKIIDIIHFSYE